jgi:hypothetical protein
MNRRLLNFLKFSVAIGFAAYLISAGILKAQRNSGEIWITDRTGRQVFLYQQSHALIIWEGNYHHWSRLENTEVEAKQLEQALVKQGFQVNIVPNPTGEQIRSAVNNFIASYGYNPDNRLVIFFTGHGHTRSANRGYLVPIDAPDPTLDEQGFLRTAIPMNDVLAWARTIEAKHVLFVFDSCFSGTVFESKSRPNPEYINTIMNKPVRQFITAGDAGQEVPAKSIFTPLFIRAIEGEADLIKDGYVTGSELGIYLTQNLSKYTKSQSPQYGKIRDVDLDRGDIVFRSLERNARESQRQTTLISMATGVDYTQLRDLLAAGKWKEADQETTRTMLQAAGREKEGWFEDEDIDNFFCEDLRIIDQLWLESSQGKFGFSVQKDIYQNLGGTGTNGREEEIFSNFWQQVGWVKWEEGRGWVWADDELVYYELRGGQLPGFDYFVSHGGGRIRHSLLFSRAKTCNL